MAKQKITVPFTKSGTRADTLLQQLLREKYQLSPARKDIKELFLEGEVLLEGKQIKPETRVIGGQVFTYLEEALLQRVTKSPLKEAKMATVEIVAKTRDFLVVCKPPGMLSHGFNGSGTQASLEDWLVEHFPKQKTLPRGGLVHRLDRNTSGLLLVARNAAALLTLQSEFREKRVKKAYIGLVEGHVKEAEGVVEKPLIRKKGSFKRLIAKEKEKSQAREAVTEYKVVTRLENHDLILLIPKTGRTHQLRAHMKALGTPLVGDTLYGSENSLLKRQFLHAFQLEFTYKDKQCIFDAPLPDDLREVLKTLDFTAVFRYDDEALQRLFSI